VQPYPSRIMKVDADEKLSVFFEDKGGQKLRYLHHQVLDAKGNLYSASDGSSQVWRISPEGKASRVYPAGEREIGVPFVGSGGGDPFTIDAEVNIFCVH
jgi:hypothetical protein